MSGRLITNILVHIHTHTKRERERDYEGQEELMVLHLICPLILDRSSCGDVHVRGWVNANPIINRGLFHARPAQFDPFCRPIKHWWACVNYNRAVHFSDNLCIVRRKGVSIKLATYWGVERMEEIWPYLLGGVQWQKGEKLHGHQLRWRTKKKQTKEMQSKGCAAAFLSLVDTLGWGRERQNENIKPGYFWGLINLPTQNSFFLVLGRFDAKWRACPCKPVLPLTKWCAQYH